MRRPPPRGVTGVPPLYIGGRLFTLASEELMNHPGPCGGYAGAQFTGIVSAAPTIAVSASTPTGSVASFGTTANR